MSGLSPPELKEAPLAVVAKPVLRRAGRHCGIPDDHHKTRSTPSCDTLFVFGIYCTGTH